MKYKFKQALLGGTFDHFHIGHQRLVDEALSQAEHVTIGISTEKLYAKKFLARAIEDYKIREEQLLQHIKEKQSEQRVTVLPLHDIYGTSLTEKNIDAIVVTKATAPNARKINAERRKLQFPALKIVIVPFVKSTDGRIVRSERIRYGEIDRSGDVYMHIFGKRDRLILPQNLREELRKPLGNIVKFDEKLKKKMNNKIIISVGDISTLSLRQFGFQPDVGIIDYKTRRQKINKTEISALLPIYSTPEQYGNKAGTIQKKAVNAYRSFIKKYFFSKEKQLMIIDGEEDLLTLPVVLLAPLDSLVFYGQFDAGAVAVPVTEEKKKEVEALLKRFQ